jgi:putative transposase
MAPTGMFQTARNRRLDRDLYACANWMYFITMRAYADQRPFVQADLNRLVLDMLREAQELDPAIVYTYCLMPDHLHCLVSPRQQGASVLTFIDRYKGRSTNRSWTVGWNGKLWQPRYYDHVVRSERNLRAIARYILDNPVSAGLVAVAEEWPWSGHMNPLPL